MKSTHTIHMTLIEVTAVLLSNCHWKITALKNNGWNENTEWRTVSGSYNKHSIEDMGSARFKQPFIECVDHRMPKPRDKTWDD